MPSHALLPVCFPRRELYHPSPEEAREMERRKDELDRLIAELRPGSRSRRDRREALANETTKRECIQEQKLLIAEAMQRSGGPDPRWNHEGRDRRHMRAEIDELSAAFEISKRRWMVTHKPSIAEDAAESLPRETEQAKPERTVPAKSAVEKHLRGGRHRSDEYYSMRRQALASYQFVTDKECEAGRPTGDEEQESRVPPRRDPLIPSTARIKVSDVAKPAGSKIERTVPAKSTVEKHLRGGRRRSNEYYAMRREVLASYQFVADKECQDGKPTGKESRFPPGRDPPIPTAARIKVSDAANAQPPGSAGAATMKASATAPHATARVADTKMTTGAPIPPRKGMTVKVRRLVGILPSTGQRLVLWLSAVVVSDAEDGFVQVIYNGDDRFRAVRLAMDDVKHMPSIVQN